MNISECAVSELPTGKTDTFLDSVKSGLSFNSWIVLCRLSGNEFPTVQRVEWSVNASLLVPLGGCNETAP